MKKISILILITVLTLMILTGCQAPKEISSNSYVSVEINPSVEFVIDSNGYVVAANGTNDDGKTLIFNVSFEGKELEEAIEIVLTEAKESNYLLVATYNEDMLTREINVSINSETEEVSSKLNDIISNTVNDFIEENEVAATYKKIEEKGRDFFETIVKKYNPMITEEELEALSYEELLEMVELATIEKAQMTSIALEEYYLSYKESEFKILYKEEIVAKLNELNPVIGLLYQEVMTGLKTSVQTLNELEYSLYVSEDSEYLQLINRLHGYKDEVIKLKAQVAVTEDSTELELEIKAKEELIAQVITEIETVMNTLRSTINSIRQSLEMLYDKLEVYEENLSIDFNEILNKVENNINDTKNGLCESFEENYSAEIQKVNNKVEERKNALESK